MLPIYFYLISFCEGFLILHVYQLPWTEGLHFPIF